jgi:hypothetical protein
MTSLVLSGSSPRPWMPVWSLRTFGFVILCAAKYASIAQCICPPVMKFRGFMCLLEADENSSQRNLHSLRH